MNPLVRKVLCPDEQRIRAPDDEALEVSARGSVEDPDKLRTGAKVSGEP